MKAELTKEVRDAIDYAIAKESVGLKADEKVKVTLTKRGDNLHIHARKVKRA